MGGLGGEWDTFTLKSLKPWERHKLWQEFFRLYMGSFQPPFSLEEISSKWKLAPGMIERIVLRFSREEPECRTERRLMEHCMETADTGDFEDIQGINYGLEWDALKVGRLQKKQLMEIRNQAAFYYRVYRDYGMERLFPYGKGITVSGQQFPGKHGSGIFKKNPPCGSV